MNENNAAGFWRTLAIAMAGLLVGLGGSLLTVELRLGAIKGEMALLKQDLTYVSRALGELQGINQSKAKEIETLRYTAQSVDYRLKTLETQVFGSSRSRLPDDPK